MKLCKTIIIKKIAKQNSTKHKCRKAEVRNTGHPQRGDKRDGTDLKKKSEFQDYPTFSRVSNRNELLWRITLVKQADSGNTPDGTKRGNSVRNGVRCTKENRNLAENQH